ncbi:MAG TPA: universal stress protein [Kofleriaceae bacterium]|nr:universal stress protein [Kofleriaceae bacterium]
MNLPKNILVPTDFSANADAALDYAVALAGKLDAKVHVLNVVAVQTLGADLGIAVTQSVVESVMEGNQKALERLVAERASKASFGPIQLELGDARTVIDQMAAKLGADLIVMGTHGRRGVRRLLLGSVAESIARTAPCPVLLLRQSETSS